MRIEIAIALIAPLALFDYALAADVVVHDDFDDGVLDPAWQITLQDAFGWTYEESGTNLTVTEIDPEVINQTGGGTWAVVKMNRSCPALEDFHVDFDISWDCQGNNAAMQGLMFYLLDAGGGAVIGAGVSDPWLTSRPCHGALIAGNWQCDPNQLPFSGAASIDIDRTDDQVTIVWDGSPIMSDTLSAPIEGVEVTIRFYAYDEPQNSFFGTEAIDLVNVEGTLISVDADTWGATKERYRE